MMDRVHKEWHRPVADVDNKYTQKNPLYAALDLNNYLGDIHDNQTVLQSFYIHDRRPVAGTETTPGAVINRAHSDEYTDNEFVLFSPSGCSRDPDTLSHGTKTEVEDFLRDPAGKVDKAEVEVARVLLRGAQLRASGPQPSVGRFFLLQGAIGSGKTTLMQHFQHISLPHLQTKWLPPVVLMTYLDGIALGGVVPLSTDAIAERLCNALRELPLCKDYFGANLRQVARNTPTLREDIRLALYEGPSPERAERFLDEHIMSYQHDHLLLLQDIVHYAWIKDRRLTLFVLDNIDHLQKETQRTCVEVLWTILERFCEHAMGIVTLREYTLAEYRELAQCRLLNVMHLTGPDLKKLIERRLNCALLDLEAKKGIQSVSLHEVLLGLRDFREFLKKWHGTFMDDRALQLVEWLSNYSARDALRVVNEVMSSPFLNTYRLVKSYYARGEYDATVYGAPWTRVISLDEILRLLMHGGRRYYSSTKDRTGFPMPNLFNSTINPKGAPRAGREPFLIKFRILDYIRWGGDDGRRLEDVVRVCALFHFDRDEVWKITRELMTDVLLESYEGREPDRVKQLHVTRKGYWFVKRVAKSLTYLEHVIGDCYLNYKEELHERQDALTTDLPRVLRFLDFVREREINEWSCINELGPVVVSEGRTFIGHAPLCWRLAKSVWKRIAALGLPDVEFADSFSVAFSSFVERIYTDIEENRLGCTHEIDELERRFPRAKIKSGIMGRHVVP